MKRFISLFLAVLTAISLFVSCTTIIPASSDGAVSIDGSSSAGAAESAEWLNGRLGEDYPGTVKLSLGASSGMDFADFPNGGYVIRTIGDETAITADSAYNLDLAVRAFANNYAGQGDVYVTHGEGYRVKSMSIDGVDISEWKIVLETLGEEGFEENPAFAASELQSYIKKACGITLPVEIRSGASVSGGKGGVDEGRVIRIVQAPKDDELGKESGHIYFDNGDLIIRGGYKRGTMYTVYEFLEKYVGWRFFGLDDMTYVIPSESLEITGDIDYESVPVFSIRRLRTKSQNARLENAPAVSVNIGDANLATLRRNNADRFAKYAAKFGYNEHTIASTHSFKKHLEGLYSGEQPCYTDEYLIEELGYSLEKDAMAYTNTYKPDQGMPFIAVGPNDTAYYCKCQNCLRAIREGEAVSAAFLGFINPAIEYVNEKYPDMTYVTIAYSETVKPPKNIRPVENVYILYCTDAMCMKHSFLDYEECTYSRTSCVEAREHLLGWAELTENLGTYMYYANFANVICPVATFKVMRENMQYFADIGIDYVTSETYNYGFGFDDLRNYMLALLYWDPYMSEEEYDAHIREFMAAYYGSGWESIYEYLGILERSAQDSIRCFSTFGDWPGLVSADNNMNPWYNPNNYEDGYEYYLTLFEDAKYLADSAEIEARINILEVHLHYFHLCSVYDSEYVNGTAEERAKYEELYLYFCDRMTYYGKTPERIQANLTNRTPDYTVEDLGFNPSRYLWG